MAGLGAESAARVNIPIALELGGVTHHATLSLETKHEGGRVSGRLE